MKTLTPESNLSADILDDLKHLICIATLGLNDADSVLVKAYFRLILRLDYQINWVPANDPNADLLLVSSFLSGFEKTQDFLKSCDIPILYVESPRTGVAGGLSSNVLFLPLTDTSLLQRWFQQYFPLLASSPTLNTAPAAMVVTTHTQPPATATPMRQSYPQRSAETSTPPEAVSQYVTDFFNVIQCLNGGEHRHVVVYDQHRLRMGVADTVQQQFWVQQAGNFALVDGWSLRLGMGENDPPTPRGSVIDLKQWLWLSLLNAKTTTRLASTEQLVLLKHWPKPPANTNRRQVLSILAALSQQPMTAKRLAQTLHMPLTEVHQIIGSLCGSGCAVLGASAQDWNPDQVLLNPPKAKGLKKLLSQLRATLGIAK